MRKSKILLLLATILLISCNKEISVPSAVVERAPADAITTNVVSIDEAENEVLSLVNMIDPMTKAGEPVRRIANRYSNGGFGSTKSDSEAEDTPLVHIFNFEDNCGYAIVAGDRRVSPILCLTDEGNINQNDVINNPGLLIALSEIDTYYRMMTGLPVTDVDGNEVTAEEYTKELQLESPTRIEPEDPDNPDEPVYSYVYGDWEDYTTAGTILPCHWNQSDPFNVNCTTSDGYPAYVGCVAIAVGQIMYHWGLNYTYKNTYWNWTKMHQIINRYSTPSDSDAWDLVQGLLRTIGLPENLDMDYGAVADGEGSGAPSANAGRTFQHFGYVSGGSLEDYNFSTLQTNLAYGPALGRGNAIKKVTVYKILGIQVDKKTSYSEGHAWVYDQALVQRRQVKEYKNGLLNRTYYATRNLVHINWGWGGNGDGYYLSTRFDANAGPVLTKGSSTTTYGTPYYYQYNLEMNCGIRAN